MNQTTVAYFDAKGLHPKRFKWQHQVYYVSHVAAFPNSYDTQEISFQVEAKGKGDTLYQLILNIPTMTWKIGLVQRYDPSDEPSDISFSPSEFI